MSFLCTNLQLTTCMLFVSWNFLLSLVCFTVTSVLCYCSQCYSLEGTPLWTYSNAFPAVEKYQIDALPTLGWCDCGVRRVWSWGLGVVFEATPGGAVQTGICPTLSLSRSVLPPTVQLYKCTTLKLQDTSTYFTTARLNSKLQSLSRLSDMPHVALQVSLAFSLPLFILCITLRAFWNVIKLSTHYLRSDAFNPEHSTLNAKP